MKVEGCGLNFRSNIGKDHFGGAQNENGSSLMPFLSTYAGSESRIRNQLTINSSSKDPWCFGALYQTHIVASRTTDKLRMNSPDHPKHAPRDFSWCSAAPPLFGSAARPRPILESSPTTWCSEGWAVNFGRGPLGSLGPFRSFRSFRFFELPT